MKLADLAATARRYAAVERRLFEVLGGWVPGTAEPEMKLALRTHSFQHAWHADLWEGLAPRVAVADAAGPVGDPLPAMDGPAEAYGVVLPALVGEYRALRDAAVPASDGPLLRVLSLVLSDEEAAIAEAAMLLEGMENRRVR